LVFSLLDVVFSISGAYIFIYIDLKREEMDGMHNGQI
ncbi:hypothetical protein CN896_31460, partial [Bacillus thuringiensis]